VIATAFIITGLCLTFIGVIHIYRVSSIQNWRKVCGKIISSKIEVITNQDFMDMYNAKIIYEYSVDNENYNSSRVAYGEANIGDLKTAEKLISCYPKNKVVIVLYNPENPSQAVLEPKITAINFFFLFFGIMILATTLILSFLVSH
jgi:Protein of unknown function (DUF3592)